MEIHLDSQQELHGVTFDVNEVLLLEKVFRSTWMGDISLALSNEEQACLSALRRRLREAAAKMNTMTVGGAT